MADENETMVDESNPGESDAGSQSDNMTGSGRRKSRSVATSQIDGTTVTFTLTNGAVVSCDVAKLPQAVQLQHALDGVRNAGRIAIQKMDDPAKAQAVITSRFEKMARGESTKTHRTNDVVDDLTQALANVLDKSVDHIENVFYPRYFASPESGCTTNTDKKGKVRVFGKKEALAKLRLNPDVRAELDKIAKARAGKAAKDAPKVDLASLAA